MAIQDNYGMTPEEARRREALIAKVAEYNPELAATIARGPYRMNEVVGSTATPQEAWSRGPAQPNRAAPQLPSGPIGSTINNWRGGVTPGQMPPSMPSTSSGVPPIANSTTAGGPVSPTQTSGTPAVVINVGNGGGAQQAWQQSWLTPEQQAFLDSINAAGQSQQPPGGQVGGMYMPPPTPYGPPSFSPQLNSSWSNAGPPAFAGNAMWQGQRQAMQAPPWQSQYPTEMPQMQQAYPSEPVGRRIPNFSNPLNSDILTPPYMQR